jgi:FkbM family methyltransferase
MIAAGGLAWLCYAKGLIMQAIFRSPRRAPVAGLPLLDPRSFQRQRRGENEALIRGLCATAYLGGSSALCRVMGRYKMFVDTADVGLSSHLMLDGYWEMWLTEALAEVLRPGMVAVDIGANLGYFTVLMADLVGPEGVVHAFEPNPPIAERLAKTVYLNGYLGNTRLYRDPLGAEDGRAVVLAVPEGEPGGAHVADPAHEGLALTARRFDSHPDLLRADVIKIDAEGAELDIWRGMSGLLSGPARPLTIFLEFAAVRYPDPRAFLAEIAAAGFSLSYLSPSEGVLDRTIDQILAAPAHADQILVLRR